MRLLTLTLLLSAALSAQHANSGSSYSGQSWVGLLVSASCDASARAKPSTAKKEADLTTTGRVTTPAVDSSGTRGQSTMQQAGPKPTENNARPKTGDVRNESGTNDPGWKAAQKQAAALPAGCAVDTSTNRFALMLPNGRIMPFDDLANEGIVKQLKAKQFDRKSIFRVQAAGKLEHGMIALDTMQL